MNEKVKVWIIAIVGSFLLFGSGFAGGYFIREAGINKRISQLENTNQKEVAARERAEEAAAGIRSAYTELARIAQQRQRIADERQSELEQSQDLNRKLISAISEAENSSEEIIRRIDSIIDKVQRLGETE